jgi:hypothetical protein
MPNSALNIGLQLADDLVCHFFEVDHFTNICLKFKHKTKADTAQYNMVYKKTEEDKAMEDLSLH